MTEGARRLSSGKGHQRTYSKSSLNAASIYTPPPTSIPSVLPAPASMPATIGTFSDIEQIHLNGSIKGSKRNPRAQQDRKASHPMMPAFMVSAPGKVIVFGEHAVVHGKVCAECYLNGFS